MIAPDNAFAAPIDSAAKVLLLRLWSYAREVDDVPFAWPGNERLASDLGVTLRSVQRSLVSLQGAGLIYPGSRTLRWDGSPRGRVVRGWILRPPSDDDDLVAEDETTTSSHHATTSSPKATTPSPPTLVGSVTEPAVEHASGEADTRSKPDTTSPCATCDGFRVTFDADGEDVPCPDCSEEAPTTDEVRPEDPTPSEDAPPVDPPVSEAPAKPTGKGRKRGVAAVSDADEDRARSLWAWHEGERIRLLHHGHGKPRVATDAQVRKIVALVEHVEQVDDVSREDAWIRVRQFRENWLRRCVAELERGAEVEPRQGWARGETAWRTGVFDMYGGDPPSTVARKAPEPERRRGAITPEEAERRAQENRERLARLQGGAAPDEVA